MTHSPLTPPAMAKRLLCVVFVALLAALGGPARADLTYTIGGSWPNAAHQAAADAAMQAVVARYNDYGDFGNYNVYVYYNAGIPTAQASYEGSIGFGGTYPNERVTAHEMAHYLGLPSGSWNSLISGGWSGAQGAALVRQFDGEHAVLNGDGVHFWPYGLNFDSEGSALNLERQVAVVYAMRADLGIGSAAHPSGSRRGVVMTADDPTGQSSFNYKQQWSDGYYAHAGTAYSTGDYKLRTPASSNHYKFYGGSLEIDNTNGANGGLWFNGQGASTLVTVDNLFLNGGWVQHMASVGTLFQLDGAVDVVSDSALRAKQGNIDVLADVSGSSALTIETTDSPGVDDRYVRFRSGGNTFTGDLINKSRFELSQGANFVFDIDASGATNTISGASALATKLNGAFDLDLSGATANSGDSWLLVTAANTTYGGSFSVNGFDGYDGVWSNGDYSFSQATGTLTLVPSWNIDGGGLWNDAGSWTSGVPTPGGEATFGSALSAPNAPASVVVDAPVSVGRMTFNNSNQYTLSGANAVTLTGGARILAKSGGHEIAAPVAGSAGLNLGGGGTVTLSAVNPYTGDTNVEEGTLRLAGAGSIANSANVNVHTGAALHVADVAGGYQVASGQTLTANAGGVVTGDVVATGGSLVAGAGTMQGNVSVLGGGALRVGGAGLPTSAAAYGYGKIDDFQGYASGSLTSGVSGGVWSEVSAGTTNARVISDGANQALEVLGADYNWRGAQADLGDAFGPDDFSLADGDEATYFFRVQRRGTATIDGVFGLTSLDGIGADSPWSELAVTLSLFQGTGAGDTTSLRAYDGDGGGDTTILSNVDANEWINVWLVVDNGAKTFQVATSTGEEDGVLFGNTFAFGRQAAAGAALDTFAGAENRSAGGRSGSTIRFDDLYRVTGSVLSNPLGIAGETLTIEGDLTLGSAASTLALDLASPDAHDRLDVGGVANLGGVLQVSLEEGAVIEEGDLFDLIDAASVSGMFDRFDLPGLAAGLSWDVSGLTLNGSIAVVAGLRGDFNGDGVVDAADYTVWRDNLNAFEDGSVLAGAGNGDGVVDETDFFLWKANFGTTLAGSAVNAVPEPGAAALVVLACSALAFRRRAAV